MFSLLYVVAGNITLSKCTSRQSLCPIGKHGIADVPLRIMSLVAGDLSRLKVDEESPLLACGRGETSVVVGSEKMSDGVSMSGVKVGCSCGGRAGRDLSTFGAGAVACGFFFLRRLAMSDS